MKVVQALLRPESKIPAIGTLLIDASKGYSLTFEAGLVTIVRVDRAFDEPWLVPIMNFVFIRPEKEPDGSAEPSPARRARASRSGPPEV